MSKHSWFPSTKRVVNGFSSSQSSQELLCLSDGLIFLRVQKAAFRLLGGAELFGQPVGPGHENVRIDSALLFQHG